MSDRRKTSKAADDSIEREFADAVERLKSAPSLDSLGDDDAIATATDGNASAGLEVLKLCAEALDAGRRSEALSTYLRRAIADIEAGLPKNTTAEQISDLVATALHLRPQRTRGKPSNAYPDWETPLGAVAAILALRGYGPEEIIVIMSDARVALEGNPLERTEAQRIRTKFAPLRRGTTLSYGANQLPQRLTPEQHHDHLVHLALYVDGRERRNADALRAILDKYPRMR